MRVDRRYRVFHNQRHPYIDVRKPMEDLTELVDAGGEEPFILHPGEFVLGQTLERVTLPNDLVARLEGKSSLGRLGLLIHSTAGFVDSGFSGNLTLELSNVANLPITIYEGMPIGQISFMRMDGPVDRPYGAESNTSKYQGQTEPTASRFFENFKHAGLIREHPGGRRTTQLEFDSRPAQRIERESRPRLRSCTPWESDPSKSASSF